MTCDLVCLSRQAQAWAEPLADVVESLFSTMLGLAIKRLPACRPIPRPLPLGAIVQITGPWNGSVLVCASEPLVRRVAGVMLQCPREAVRTAELHDALAEVANIIGGGLKTLVPGPATLSLPTVFSRRDGRWQVPQAASLACRSFYCGGDPIVVRLLGKPAKPGVEEMPPCCGCAGECEPSCGERGNETGSVG